MRAGVNRLLAAGAVACLAALAAVLIVVAADGPEAQPVTAAAPPECLRAWNRDESALRFSRHNAIAHRYDSAQVGYIDPGEGSAVTERPAGGTCVIVFPRASLDPEPFAAGQALLGGLWAPLSGLMPLRDVERIQGEAFEGANAHPTSSGRVVALEVTEP